MNSFFNKSPIIEVEGPFRSIVGWQAICRALKSHPGLRNEGELRNGTSDRWPLVLVIECYQGVMEKELVQGLEPTNADLLVESGEAMKDEDSIIEMVRPDVGEDRVFGYMTRLNMRDYFDAERLEECRRRIREVRGLVIVTGPGASLVWEEPDLLVYADMARWEIQRRMRNGLVDNLGVNNREVGDWMLLYKQGFFVDWRVCDRHKKQVFHRIDYLLDTNRPETPKLVGYEAVRRGLALAACSPFSVVPFFDPGPWGGQWMRNKFGLDDKEENYAWCFNCVPEENSLLLNIGGEPIEIPAINLVFMHPEQLLGEPVHARFGDEFPIRFDYLDTMEGGNLSLQVHPTTEYIQETFGMHYTQDESYYLMDAGEDASVYLGLKEDADPESMITELKASGKTGQFDAEKYVEKWPAKKHDHFLIPGGTIHCSGAGSMVLEISATPYIFTFKLWDWGRLGLDGKPRPIHIHHGEKVIQWQRTTEWTRKELVNRIEKVSEGDGWMEERTGLHEREFIETRRHWFTKKVPHHTGGGVNVLNLVEGSEVIVESPSNAFKPVVFRYAETFIVPASVGNFTISPYGSSAGMKCATIKAFVRF